MPVLWRYLLRSYLQVFTLCVLGFIAVLLVTRVREIAQFASSGAAAGSVCVFTLYQIPYILPIAIPVSCLIAAILLFQKLSHTYELTALRAAGLGLRSIAFPLICAGSLIGIFNLTVASEIGPRCRALSKEMIFEMTALNPLFLFQKDTLVKLKDTYVDMKRLKAGACAEDVVFIINNRSHGRLGVMTARELSLDGKLLLGKDVAFISSTPSKQEEGFDHLIIENQSLMSTTAASLSSFIHDSDWHTNYDYLPLRMIFAKQALEKRGSRQAFGRAHEEITRRLSLGVAAFTFTFIGVAFGMEIGRNRTKRGVLWAAFLSALFLVCFVGAKSLRHSPVFSCLLYLAPHPLILLCSLRALKRLSQGVE
jgi:lipopolysaccharide export system permease protein